MTYAQLPTVTVTARVYLQDGKPVYKAAVSLRLTTTERYGGYIVPREVKAETDAQGAAILRVWPNELGTEGSEYRVTIRIPEGNGTRTVSGHAVVPNSDCDLSDIMELPGYEQRGAGEVIPAEVAGYAAQASSARDAAQMIFEATMDTETRLSAAATGAEAAKNAAQSAAVLTQQNADAAGELVASTTHTVESFERDVVSRVDVESTKLISKAMLAVEAAKNTALEGIDSRASEAIGEITEGVAGMKAAALNSISVATDKAAQRLDVQSNEAILALKEEGELFVEDCKLLQDRAEYAAKQAGCYASSASKSAQSALATEERINERVKLFDTCYDVYEYAEVSKSYAESAALCEAGAQAAMQGALACEEKASASAEEASIARNEALDYSEQAAFAKLGTEFNANKAAQSAADAKYYAERAAQEAHSRDIAYLDLKFALQMSYSIFRDAQDALKIFKLENLVTALTEELSNVHGISA